MDFEGVGSLIKTSNPANATFPESNASIKAFLDIDLFVRYPDKVIEIYFKVTVT